MGHVPLDKLTAGMITAGDVCDRSGRRLLAAGTTLSEEHLHTLRSWGVPAVDVADWPTDAELSPPALDLAVQATLENEVKKRFSRMDLSHPAVRVLFNISVQRLARERKCG